MPRVTPAHLDARRQSILAAAHHQFARHGFHDATMQGIADEAGLSVGALYRYFDGKEALIEALAEWGLERRRASMEALESGAGHEALSRLVTEMVGQLLVSEDAAAAVRLDVRLWGEALGETRLRRIVAGGLASFREPLVAFVRRERKAGRIRADIDPEMVARALLSLMAGLELQLAFDGDFDLDAYGGSIRRLLESLAPRHL